ncbi:MAG: hypothetical protein JO332_01895 [Planctomycetaceae bacterium]|nr:hypothetical protein [Planctomycetaceae bacterium]
MSATLETSVLLQTGTALATVFAAGILAFPLLRASRTVRVAGLSALAVAIFLAPLLVPLPFSGFRLLVSLASIMVGVKLYDLCRSVESGPPPGIGPFLTHLPNDCLLVFRGATDVSPSRRAEEVRLLGLIPLTLCSAAILVAAFRFDWRPYPWVLEHVAKAMAICGVIRFGPNIGACARRRIGIPALDFSGRFLASATPAEFWRRWNRPAGRFLSHYVFRPTGGNRHPFLAVMATFGLNGLVHEYVFGIAAGRVLGWALVFFGIQGPATAATLRLRPAGWGRPLGILLTLAFNAATSVLIFACVDAIVPFYAGRTGP